MPPSKTCGQCWHNGWCLLFQVLTVKGSPYSFGVQLHRVAYGDLDCCQSCPVPESHCPLPTRDSRVRNALTLDVLQEMYPMQEGCPPTDSHEGQIGRD